VELRARLNGMGARLKRARLKQVVIAALVALAVGGTAAGTAAALTTPGARPPVAYSGVDGWSQGRARPAVIYIGGPDAFVRTPHWSRWTTSSAYGRGTLWVNTCQPNCAAGHYAKYRAGITLSGAAVHRGVSYFSQMKLSYYHARPRDYGFRWATYPGATVPLWIGGPGA
jgi:hypothetical protein